MRNKKVISKASQVRQLAEKLLGARYDFSSFRCEALNYTSNSKKVTFSAIIHLKDDAAIHVEGGSFKGLLADLKTKTADR